MPRRYFTLCVWSVDHGCWFDEFGATSRAEVMSERDSLRDDGVRAKHLAVIVSDGSAAGMIAARDRLPAPK